jgi:hypothetical protein
MSLFDQIPSPDPARFDGAVYDPKQDDERLSGQIERVYHAMSDGEWRTLHVISLLTMDPPASISAQLRHLRKERFGAYLVEKRLVDPAMPGLWEYRLGAKGAGRMAGVPTPSDDALRLADELLDYVRHRQFCALRNAGLSADCTCGLDALRIRYRAVR